ncbi:MAG: hypothetical protein M0R06_06915 [Sphaerochaeta sp.]|jgi:hypothetical protein|nr:hypothetical protein [Sphaerochaeta sp.]
MTPTKYANKASEAATVESLREEVNVLTKRLMSLKPNVRQSRAMRRIMAEYSLESAQEVEKLQLTLMAKAIRRQLNVFDLII